MNEQQVKFLLGVIATVVLGGVLFGRLAVTNPTLTSATVVGVLAVGFVLFRGLDTRGLDSFQTLYYVLFLITLALVWSPFKFAAYLAPMVFIGLMIVGMSRIGSIVVLARFCLIVGAWGVLTLIQTLVYPDFVVQNSIISFFTWSAFFPLFLIPSRFLVQDILLRKVMVSLAWMILFQAAYGMMQFGYGFVQLGGFGNALGDYVEGTIHPALRPQIGGATFIYVTNMGMCVAALLGFYYRGNRRYIFPALAGVIALILADRVHVSAIFAIAIFLAYVAFRPRFGTQRQHQMQIVGLVVLVGLGALAFTTSQNRVSQSGIKLERLIQGDNEKFELYRIIFLTLPREYPASTVLGLGPGQFSSRASAIAAGYLGYLPRPFVFTTSAPFLRHGLPLWHRHYAQLWGGSVERPAASWASVIGEFGIPVFLAIGFAVFALLVKLRRRARTNTDRGVSFALCAGILFIFGLGIADLYWENCQSIFLGLLVLQLLWANHMHRKPDTTDSAADKNPPPPKQAPPRLTMG